MRRFAVVLLLATACTTEPIGRVSLGLGDVPEQVNSVSFFVVDIERDLVVASATVTAPASSVELGVPAEVPLDFRAIARTDRPGPRLAGGTMPAYAARAQRVVPLGREQIPIDLLARPAGVLSFVTRFSDDADDDVELSIAGESEVGAPLRIRVESPGGERAVVLPIGRYTVTAEEHVVLEGEGLFVAREQESIAVLSVEPTPSDEVRGVTVRIEGCEACRSVETSSSAPTAVTLTIDAFDESQLSVDVEDAMVTFELESDPPGLVTSMPGPVTGLPATVEGLEVSGRGRVVVTAVVTDDPEATATLTLDVGPIGGDPDHLELSLDAPDEIARGTELRIAILDADGRFARPVPGQLDLTASDPFVFLPDGTALDLAGDEPAVLLRRVQRSSAPRGVEVTVVATLTSTTVPGTWTSTLTLPLLEISEE